MQASDWLLLTTLAIVAVVCWRVSLELRATRLRTVRLMRRVKRLRRLILLDRLDHLERDIRDIEDLLVRRRPQGHNSEDTGASVASYVATCRSFVHRRVAEGGGQEQADAVARVVLGHLVRNGRGLSERLGQILTPDEHDRWLKKGTAK